MTEDELLDVIYDEAQLALCKTLPKYAQIDHVSVLMGFIMAARDELLELLDTETVADIFSEALSELILSRY